MGTALATDPLHGSITSSTVLGPLTARFLQAIGAGTNLGESEDVLGKALANVPAGLPKSELTKIAGLANVLGPTGPHQGGAIPDGSPAKPVGSVANLEETSRNDLKNLLPPQHH